MQRYLLSQLIEWKDKAIHLPILLWGARQVGKTFLAEYFGRHYFDNVVSINFEEDARYASCFDTLTAQDIINKIEVVSRQRITPGKTLLFLDEIQVCPQAITALRYFKEQCPALHVIAAGSLLEFALRDKNMSMPVGRVQYLYLKPVSFREYLTVVGHDKLQAIIDSAELGDELPQAIHEEALRLVREYMAIGGMPMVVNSYLENQAYSECQDYQTLILKTYSDDFVKYAETTRHKYLQRVYDATPGLVGQQIKYVNISPDMDSRYLKDAIEDLNKAGVIAPIYSTSAAGLPFITHIQEKKFKLLFLDVGLLNRSARLDMALLLSQDLMLLNRGAIAEQFVGQELLAYQPANEAPQLFYWARDKRGSSAEVDYLINVDSTIVPVEVKSGKTGSLKSLHLLMRERDLPVGVRISEKPLALDDNILSIPFYMISRLGELVVRVTSQSI